MNSEGVACSRCRTGRLVCKRVVNGRFVIEECDRCHSMFVKLLDVDKL